MTGISVLDWYDATAQALLGLWQGFLNFIPELVGALIIFIVGWIISAAVGRLISDVLKRAKFNQIFERGGWRKAMERAEIKVDPSGFVGAIFKWVLVIVFLLAAVEVLGLTEFAGFVRDVLGYLPNVIVATLIFVAAVIIADIVEKLLRVAVEGAEVGYGHVVGVIVRWSIWIFAIIAILVQLGISRLLLQTVFTGLVAFLVLAGGLAFGLGGKDVAGEILRDFRNKMR
ncbi:MAG: hypothetical protein Q8Q38_01190 [bacterium]|nr:hypothetical protein [bacterium]